MNLPNKLTMLRILLIPVFMVVLYWDFPGATWVAVAIFIVASFTDLLDGKIARKYNLVTDFGKFAGRIRSFQDCTTFGYPLGKFWRKLPRYTEISRGSQSFTTGHHCIYRRYGQ